MKKTYDILGYFAKNQTLQDYPSKQVLEIQIIRPQILNRTNPASWNKESQISI